MAEFQKEVLDVIGNANKCLDCGSELQCMKCGKKIDLRGVIISRLKESKALRSSVRLGT
jgi:DNA-directed RNA polymerase subunit RPC12/RpoP